MDSLLTVTYGQPVKSSVLTLDKSDEPFPIVLQQACSTLDIDIDNEWKELTESNGRLKRNLVQVSDPRPEWTLRWLLKKLQSAESFAAESPSHNWRTWLLLRALVLRAPLKMTARILKEQIFTLLLRDTLQELCDRRHELSSLSEDAMLQAYGSSSSSDPGHQNHSRTSRKRKRGVTEVSHSQTSPSPMDSDIDRTFVAVCGLLAQLQTLIEDPKHLLGFATEHLKNALRPSAEDAAVILQSCLYLMIDLRQARHKSNMDGLNGGELPKHLQILCVSSPIALWRSQVRILVDSYDDSINRLFRDHCMLPALALLDTCRGPDNSDPSIASIPASLRKILMDHVLLPYRTAIKVQMAGQPPMHQIESPPLAVDMVSKFASFRFPLRGGQKSAQSKGHSQIKTYAMKTQGHLTLSLLSLLFELALGCQSRYQQRLRRAEDTWLEALFKQLLSCARALMPEKRSTTAKRHFGRLVKWLLRKANDHELQLSRATLEALLEETSGLLSREDAVAWGVVGLVISNDANVYLAPSDSDVSTESSSTHTPSRYLAALLSQITDCSPFKGSRAIQDNDYVLNRVVLKLLASFSKARNLTEFLHHWQAQLNLFYHRYLGPRSSLWEDERLLESAAALVQSSLTAGQIDQVISAAVHELASMPGTSQLPFMGNLVVLDCVFAGLSDENVLETLQATAQSVYSVLDKLLALDTPLRFHQWRIWRVLGAISSRSCNLHRSPAFKHTSQSATLKALNLLGQIRSQPPLPESVNLKQEMHSFRFLCSFMHEQGSSLEDGHILPTSKTTTIITIVLDTMQSFCQRVKSDIFGRTRERNSLSKWDDLADSGTISEDLFYFGCVSYLLRSPEILSHNPNLISILIEQLYWCAVYQQRLPLEDTVQSIDYSWPWNELLHWQSDQNLAMTARLRAFIVERYLVVSDLNDPDYFECTTADYIVAFRSIQTVPMNVLDRRHRSDIANRILRVLLRANLPNVRMISDHSLCLVSLLAIPNMEMHLMSNDSDAMLAYGTYTMGQTELALISLARRIDGYVHWSAELAQSVTALNGLTHSVLSYLLNTTDHESTVNYLCSFIQRINAIIVTKNDDKTDLTAAISSMFGSSLSHLSKDRNRLTGPMRDIKDSLDRSRQDHFAIIIRSIYSLDMEDRDMPYALASHLETITHYIDLLNLHHGLRELSEYLFDNGRLARWIEEQGKAHLTACASNNREIIGDRKIVDILKARLLRLEVLLVVRDSSLHPSIEDASRTMYDVQTPKARSEAVDCVRDAMHGLSPENKKKLCFKSNLDTTLSPSELRTLGLAVFSLNDVETRDFGEDISRSFIMLCKTLSLPVAFRNSMLSMQCISMSLQKHAKVISQWHIDTLLSTTASKASHIQDRIEEKHSAMLYLGLCRIFSTILAIHRPKIGGRYHLVLLALQSLLHCLFIPYRTGEAVDMPHSAFNHTHAASYARLLTNICDPTVSSVARTKNRSRLELNDETKKARSIAGQHLHYLIMDYCTYQLQARLLPEVKAALDPGLHAVLTVMTPEIMRTMNAALDESGRAVWKSLYEDYRRANRDAR